MTREEEGKHIKITDITYREEVPRLYKTANYLSLLFGSVTETPRVVVLGKQCPDTIRATLAVLLAGGAVVELFPTKSREQLLDESSRSGATLALVENRSFADAMDCPTLTFEELEEKVNAAPILSTLPDVYPFQLKMTKGSFCWNGYLLVPPGALLRKDIPVPRFL